MAIRKRNCIHCSSQFEYKIAKGTDRIYCSDKCAKENKAAKIREQIKDFPECSALGCVKKVRSSGSEYCEMHYARIRRNGSLDRKRLRKRYLHSGGYVLIRVPNHPLTERTGDPIQYEHRVIYYDSYGQGPFNCYWCDKTITWDNLHIDHLNDRKQDNQIDNLVASCPICNQKRGRHKMIDKVRRKSPTQITAHGLTLSMNEWSRYLGISRSAIKWRLNAGWNIEDALTPRRGKSGPRSSMEPMGLSGTRHACS